ncbi:hypothetical protein [Pseudohaliea sp.]|uniref:hypothetical protein n=1 Tax=Pseudohaliea sp. TaxID=2740289 RepID=UPI0032EDEBCF
MKKTAGFLTVSLLIAAGPALAQPPLPQGLFVCHVLTSGEQDGLVFVQADDIERARVVASESAAFVAGSPPLPAAAVVECVPQAEAGFRSAAANDLLEGLVL